MNEQDAATFENFPASDADASIQWKGTDVCMDMHCPCGFHNHYDTDFAYYIRCGGCDAVYRLGTSVKAIKLEGEDADAWRRDAKEHTE